MTTKVREVLNLPKDLEIDGFWKAVVDSTFIKNGVVMNLRTTIMLINENTYEQWNDLIIKKTIVDDYVVIQIREV
jgi:hypothetical protein